jgi:hypothetical protein
MYDTRLGGLVRPYVVLLGGGFRLVASHTRTPGMLKQSCGAHRRTLQGEATPKGERRHLCRCLAFFPQNGSLTVVNQCGKMGVESVALVFQFVWQWMSDEASIVRRRVRHRCLTVGVSGYR